MGAMLGAGGQAFIMDVISKFKYLEDKYLLVGVDGGINDSILDYLKNKHIDIFVSGSYVCMNADFNKQIDNIKVQLG